MKTKEEREKEFRRDFAKLLKKHNAFFEVVDGIAVITIVSEFDRYGNITAEYTVFTI